MDKLSNSNIERQNILNNRYALERVQEYVGLPGMLFEGQYWFTKQMVADFYEIDISTIDRYLDKYSDELKHNGYFLSRGKHLKSFKLEFAHLIDKASKTTQLGLFNFRSFLNMGMLLVESDKARMMRSKILDIVIDTINQRTGGNTKYINQRDTDYFTSAIKEPKYRKEFTSALSSYLDMGNYKYAVYTDKIYQFIFKENAQEYKRILKLKDNENVRETMYAEVLNLIASFESGLAYEMKKASEEKGRKILPRELDEIFNEFASHPAQYPHVENARIKMASRDLHFRDSFHQRLEQYIHSVSPSDFDRFIGEQSMDFDEQLNAASDIFKRLKESE